MGPFSNNNSPQLPAAPSGGSKLPIPDVDGAPQPVVVSPEPDRDGVRKWLNITFLIVGVMAIAGIIIFAAYAYISNTPGYMLSAAFQNFVNSNGQAGTFSYEVQQGGKASRVQGDFLGYSDPDNAQANSLTVSAGQDASRVSATVRLFADGNYLQVAGLENMGRLVGSLGGDTSALTPDNLVRLGSLDGQWYSITSDDIHRTSSLLPQHTVQDGPTSSDAATIGQLYLQHQFMISVRQQNDERINGVNTMHLTLGIDQTKLHDFLQALQAARLKSLAITDSDIQAVLKSDLLSSSTLEIWINRTDRTLQQIRLARANLALTVTFQSADAIAQRQGVPRPDGAQSASIPVQSIHDVLTAVPAR